jgi:hypothetical protein
LDLRERKWQEAGEDCIMRSFITCTLHKILGYQNKEGEMDRTCSIHGREVKHSVSVRKTECKTPVRRPRHRWEANIRMNVRETGWEGVDWIHMFLETL